MSFVQLLVSKTNREGAKDAKEEKEEDSVLPLRSLCLRGLIIPINLFSTIAQFAINISQINLMVSHRHQSMIK